MSGSFLSRSAFICLGMVLSCSGGDLTLPNPTEPAAPAPATLRIASGDDQRADAGALLDKPLRVQVLDGGGEPLGSVTVQFSFVGELPNAGLEPASTLTDEEGHAVAFVRLGSVPGEQLIAARVAGTEAPNLSVWFRATALPGEDDGDQGGGGDGGGDDDDEGSEDDDDSDGGSAPDPLGIPVGHYPPSGSCRVWQPGESPGQQSSPTSCGSAQQQAPAGSWIIARPGGASGEIHVLVIHPDRAGVVVRRWIYDADSGRLLREEEA